MNVPANVSGEKLATDYLASVTVAGLRYLPKGDRMVFVGQTRARIEERCGPLPQANAETVAALLAELGDPEDLVKAERVRLDEARSSRRPPAAPGAPPATAAPWQQRPVTSRWKPGGAPPLAPPLPRLPRRRRRGRIWGGRLARRSEPVPRPPGPEQPDPGKPAPGPQAPGRADDDADTADLPAVTDLPADTREPQLPGPDSGRRGPSPVTRLAAPRPPQPRVPGESAGPEPARQGARPQEPAVIGPVPVPGGDEHDGGPGAGPGAALPGGKAGKVPGPRWAELAWGHRRETLAVALLGVGGLLLPFPFWLAGAFAVLFSRLWDARDKWAALAGPGLIALAGTILLAPVVGGEGNPVVVYLHVLRLDARYLVRLGCLATAGYLAWRVRRGPRPRIPPWRKYRPGAG